MRALSGGGRSTNRVRRLRAERLAATGNRLAPTDVRRIRGTATAVQQFGLPSFTPPETTATTPQALAQSQATEEPGMQHRQALAAARLVDQRQLGSLNLSFGGLVGGLAKGLSGLVPGGRSIFDAAQSLIGERGRGTNLVSGPGTGAITQFGGPCPSGLVKIGNSCVDITAALPGGRPFVQEVPATRVERQRDRPSRLGGGFPPMMIQSMRSDCGPKHILGDDGLCYPKRGFPNGDRMWPRGRQPLLTGGERNAITKASRAAKKIERTTKQLQRLGMIKKPSTQRRQPPRAPQHQIAPGATRIINVGD